MQALFFAFTLDSICEIAFGVKLGALSGHDVPFMRAFDSAQCIVERRWYAPWWPGTYVRPSVCPSAPPSA
jgi:hypothetical protein